MPCEHDSSNWHEVCDQQTLEAYNVELVRNGSCKYNCHSYAWYSQSTSNRYWISDPVLYMSDGGYTRVLNGMNYSSTSVLAGDIMFYGEITGEGANAQITNLNTSHSAIIVSGATAAPLRTRVVESKWGIGGVFRHQATEAPAQYNTIKLSAWRING